MADLDTAAAGGIVRQLVAAIVENATMLGELDGRTGDGDHGINMSKGFRIAESRLPENPSLSAALTVLADALLGDIGGSTGPLYGTFFSTLAEGIDTPSVDAVRFGTALRGAVEAVQDLGGAKPGDKTLIDVLVPASAAYDAALAGGADFSAAMAAMNAAAATGFEQTRDMVAKIGRAARLGERSRGTPDAGAASANLLLATLADGISGRLAG